MKKWINLTIIFLLIFISAFIIVFISVPSLRSQIMQISGLAVAQTSTRWNNVRDGAAGDDLITGILATGTYFWDGTNWDRPWKTTHGDNTTVTSGQNVAAIIYGFDGTNYDRVRVDALGNLLIAPYASGTNFYAIKRTNIAAVSQNIAFGFTSRKVIVETDASNTDEVVVDWKGAAAVVPAANTAGDDRIAAGRIVVFDDFAVTSISVIAVSGTQTISVRAFN